MKIQIFSASITPRLHYICNYIFNQIADVEYELISDVSLVNPDAKLINYSTLDLQCDLKIIPAGLIHESGIQSHLFVPVKIEETIQIFHSVNCPYGFDVFAAIFFMLSRYEEYHCKEKDTHQRMKAESSLAYQNGFLEVPVVDIWVGNFLKKLGIQIKPQHQFKYLQTFDIDNAYAYRYKGLGRNIGGLLSAFFKLEWRYFWQRIMVLGDFMKDPYDSYGYQLKIVEKTGVKPIWFLQIGDYSKYDTNIPVKSSGFLHLISYFKKFGSLGLHPSYASNSDVTKLQKEHKRLSKINGVKITQSRQHYLVIRWPATYRNLIDLGITDDYTMGFSSHSGFRAGTCRPFLWYDLEAEESTQLTVHPFFCMDGTLREYMKLNPDEAIEKIQLGMKITLEYGGEYVSLWHNHSVSDKNEWKGWRRVFEAQYDFLKSINYKTE